MEQTFLLNQGELQVPCKVTEPDFGEIRRVVLGVHGLGGSSNDDIQVSLAEEMEFFSSVVYRFDFPAHGESPLESEFFTLMHCREALLAVAEHAKASYPQVEDLCIFATGFGAYVTLVTMDDLVDLPGNIRLVVQTPSVRMDKTLLAMVHISHATLQAMGKTTMRTARPLDVTYSLYEELVENLALRAYPIPFLVLHGENDTYISMEDIQHLVRLNERARLVIIPGTSHRFLEAGAWDMVLDLTRDWFEFEQVLLGEELL